MTVGEIINVTNESCRVGVYTLDETRYKDLKLTDKVLNSEVKEIVAEERHLEIYI